MLIGIIGLIGSGKDTISDILVETEEYTKLSFADPVKDVVSVVFGWDREMLEGSTKESREWRNVVDVWWSETLDIPKFTPRMAMQMIGTDLFREHFRDNIWIENTVRRCKQYPNVVIADVRFKNEAKSVLDDGGILIRVERGEKPTWYHEALAASKGDVVAQQFMETNYPAVHRSEWDCLSVEANVTFSNNGTIEALRKKVLDLIKDLT